MIYASNKNTQGVARVRTSMEDFGILWMWGFPQVFLWVWDGYGH